MSKCIKRTIQFMAFVRHDPGSRVMATEDTADTFNLYLDGVEWTPNIDRRGYVDPQMGEDEFQRALAAARRLIVLNHDMRRGCHDGRGWLVRSPEYPCKAWGEEPEEALDALRALEAKHEEDVYRHIRREAVIPLASGGPERERFSVSYGDHYETFPTWEEAVAFFYSITQDSE